MTMPVLSPQTPSYSYEKALRNAAKVNWRIEDVIGANLRLDFTRRFMPETLARVNEVPFLSSTEKLKLNQIRGHSYLHIFGLVEEFIVPTVIDHVRRLNHDDMVAVQSLLHFAEEESKHIRLFRHFAAAFELGFGSRCEGIGPVRDIANAVLQHQPLGVMLVILYIEWMTQRHYLESVRDNASESLDGQFCSLLRHHWLEEAQHAALDTLMAQTLAQSLTPAEISTGVEDFFQLLELLDRGLMAQVQLDLESLAQATGRTLTVTERATLQTLQEQSYRWTFLGSGLVNHNFVRTFSEISSENQSRLMAVAQAYCLGMPTPRNSLRS